MTRETKIHNGKVPKLIRGGKRQGVIHPDRMMKEDF
jgi:hypothetical protein